MRQAERILSEGAAGLPDTELLRVVLGGRDELLAGRLLSRGLASLRRASAGELLLEAGMNAALAARVIAALELGRRVALAPAADRRRLLRARDVAAALWGRLAHLPHEEFWAVLMNARLQEIRCVQIARGGLTQCSVSPREAFAPALLHRAAAAAFGSERGVTLTLIAPTGIRVAAEHALVERILAPLIENAYRYAVREVRIEAQRDSGAVVFNIEDDGPGIPDAAREAIFEPGRRAADPGARVGTGATAVASHGAGLGLALSRRLARTAGGDVEAEHSDAAGGRLVVRLPAA